ncbi:hypothetical protein ABZ848_35455 [Streptomyces sp. NPDC047081]|uniref:hypothetical protein n=1 Tax=Streptomyces sp. NPDC047081 TaxID=3154706 RepID=UPI0033F26302
MPEQLKELRDRPLYTPLPFGQDSVELLGPPDLPGYSFHDGGSASRVLRQELRWMDAVACSGPAAVSRVTAGIGGSQMRRTRLLVAAMADRYGVEPTPAGKRSWAEVTVIKAAAALALSGP